MSFNAEETLAALLAALPNVPKRTAYGPTSSGGHECAWESFNTGFLGIEITKDREIEISWDLDGYQDGTFSLKTTLTDREPIPRLEAAMEWLRDNFEPDDVWDSHDDFGYADMNFLGSETWEDTEGYKQIAVKQGIPDSWFVMKVVNFSWTGDRTLKAIEAWLEENCKGQFKRFGWTSNCSTKVGVAFENMLDATYFKLRWR